VDALYFRVSSDRQTTENQFEDLVQIAERDDSGRDWRLIREALARVVIAEVRSAADGAVTLYRVVPQIAHELARLCVYVEQGRSGRAGAKKRPLFEQMKRDAAERKFERVLVWKVSRLGRDMREVIATVYDLADHGVSVFPVKSQTGPINSTIGKLLWAIQAWSAEMENEERSEAVIAGQNRARAAGKLVGRPRVIFDRQAVLSLRDTAQKSWREIAHAVGTSVGSARRAYAALKGQ
jgi:DNA invertase Pin-like site-specific DNA recombinase